MPVVTFRRPSPDRDGPTVSERPGRRGALRVTRCPAARPRPSRYYASHPPGSACGARPGPFIKLTPEYPTTTTTPQREFLVPISFSRTQPLLLHKRRSRRRCVRSYPGAEHTQLARARCSRSSWRQGALETLSRLWCWCVRGRVDHRSMALEAETVLRPLFLAAGGGDGEVSSGREAPPLFFLATEKDRPVDPMIWGDEKRMKRELLVWAKAVASMAASNNNTSSFSSSSSPSRSARRRG